MKMPSLPVLCSVVPVDISPVFVKFVPPTVPLCLPRLALVCAISDGWRMCDSFVGVGHHDVPFTYGLMESY